jgi:hypothetical protein
MLLDNVIQPVGDIADVGFIGWQPPPNPNDQTASG